MSASEFAFLALGLVLGVASGAAYVVVFRSRPPAREVRVTMTRDAVPRRSETLSTDAFADASAEPAPGGPADPGIDGPGIPAVAPVPVAAAGGGPDAAPSPTGRTTADWPAADSPYRTLARDGVALVGLSVRPSPAPRVLRAINPLPSVGPVIADRIAAAHAGSPAIAAAFPSALLEVLRGDRSILVSIADAAAEHDRRAAAEWEVRLDLLVAALTARALDLGVLDFPLGHPFWDDFTIEECRRLAATLAAAGHRFDGGSRWSGAHVPTHAELTAAVAACGIQPTRVRSWPSRTEIGDLYRGARIAWADLLAVAPSLAADELRVLLGDRGAGLDTTWVAWEDVRPHLLTEARASVR